VINNPSDAPSTQLERLRLIRDIVAAEAAALTRVASDLGPGAVEAAEWIAECRGCVVVTGVGKAGLVGQKLVATLSSTGNRAHFLHPSEAVHGDLGRVGTEDLVWAISNSGRSDEVLKIAPHLRRHSAGLIAMTASARNPLAELADIVVPVGTHDEADPLGLAPTTSTTVMMAVGDAISLLASQLVGFRASDFARFHPGGSLGQQLAPVNRLMRPLASCRTAPATGTVRETMVVSGQMGRRTGAVMLLSDCGQVVGLFTDSDLARLLENRRDDLLDGPIRDVMTTSFQKVDSGMLLMEAIEILKHRRISELPVVDGDGRPVGLLDITDVIAMAPVYSEQTLRASATYRTTLPIDADGAVARRRRA
jgi:arabinose-5-phosphate isomerase